MELLLPKFIIDDISYGPINLQRGTFNICPWPNSCDSLVREKYNGVSTFFKHIVDDKHLCKKARNVKRLLIEETKNLNNEAIFPMIDLLEGKEKLQELGRNYSMLLNLIITLKKADTLLCKFSGCDPVGKIRFRKFIYDNLDERAVIELDNFYPIKSKF